MNPTEIIANTRCWLEQVVIGLNLCPFARKPLEAGKVRFFVSSAQTEDALLADLQNELLWLVEPANETVETSIVIAPAVLQNFMDYNNFLGWADELIVQLDLEGVLQVASFHPDYCFADTEPSEAGNLTNRSPYPLLHILREDLLEQMLDKYPNTDAIPEQNIIKMTQLSPAERARLFPYLLGT